MPCAQICHNVPGTFVCDCQEGYNLVRTVECEGMQYVGIRIMQHTLCNNHCVFVDTAYIPHGLEGTA